jgi:acetate kinase
MKILVLNCGSSSLKFQVLELSNPGPGGEVCLVKGRLRIGKPDQAQLQLQDGKPFTEPTALHTQRNALTFISDFLKRRAGIQIQQLDALGFRVVHGGDAFYEPVELDEEIVHELAAVSELAPLHNGPALEAIQAAHSLLDDSLPMVAVFDTTFHHALPEVARRYAIPEAIAAKHHLWRYGFHGLAHRWMAERYQAVTAHPLAAAKIIAFQLGSGCSVAAIRDGRPVETSMGLTPLEGLMMGTRCGDIDPALPGILAARERITLAQAEDILNKRSGLLGVSGISSDPRELLAAEKRGDCQAKLALDLFCHRARKYLGAYLAVLGGAQAVIFGGGIGENQPAIRARICEGMEWVGLKLDEIRNLAAIGQEACISEDDSTMSVHVIPVNEELLIARDVFATLNPEPMPLPDEHHAYVHH